MPGQIYLSPQVQGAAILVNSFRGPRRIDNQSHSQDIAVDDAPLNIPDLPASFTQYTYLPKQKPLHPENFFNVAAAPYRAVKGGKRDCTAAIQRALDDAAAGRRRNGIRSRRSVAAGRHVEHSRRR